MFSVKCIIAPPDSIWLKAILKKVTRALMHLTETITTQQRQILQITHNTGHRTCDLVDGDPTQPDIFLVNGSRGNDMALSHRQPF